MSVVPLQEKIPYAYNETGDIEEAHDALNRVTETADKNRNRTCYKYDPSGNIIQVVNDLAVLRRDVEPGPCHRAERGKDHLYLQRPEPPGEGAESQRSPGALCL